MNTKTKRRMVAVTGVIVIVMIIVLAIVGGSSTAKTVTIADLADGSYVDQKVQVTGNVVENSFSTDDNDVLTFSIYDPEGDVSQELVVQYDGGVSSTFGNDVTAICTGKVDSEGVLKASELVTKCPSKYESSTDALTVEQLVGYGDSVYDKPVKVAGVVKSGTLTFAGSDERFVLADGEGSAEISVKYDGALSEEIADGSNVVLTGSVSSDGAFTATDVAIEG